MDEFIVKKHCNIIVGSNETLKEIYIDETKIKINDNNKCSRTKTGDCLTNEDKKIIEEEHNENKSYEEIKEKFKCNDDLCVVEAVNTDKVKLLKVIAFKPIAPRDSISWLSNTDIDTIQEQLYNKFPNYYYSYIHMIDLVMFPPEFKDILLHPVEPIDKIDFSNEILKNYDNIGDNYKQISIHNNDIIHLKTYGVVCNTDTSKQRGQHWFAIFMDFRSNPYTIEYFNSSGYPIQNKNFKEYFMKLAEKISNETKVLCNFIQVTKIQHQGEETGNCGAYALYYIWGRMIGMSMKDFDNPNNTITDDKMVKFREFLFREPDSK